MALIAITERHLSGSILLCWFVAAKPSTFCKYFWYSLSTFVEGVHDGWIRNCAKGDGPRGSGRRKSPVGSRGKAKCEIRVQFLTFSCTKFLDFINTGAQLGQYLCTNTQLIKSLKIQLGVLSP